MNRIYLDYNATTPVDPEVLDAMLPFFSTQFGNAASIHSFGQRAAAAVEIARESIAALLGARQQDIVFTSGGTESDNHAIFGIIANASVKSSLVHVITSQIEHEAVLNACQELERRRAIVTYLPVDAGGRVDPQAVKDAIRPETALISIMHSNNELGTVQPVAEIGEIAAEADIYFHTDAVQSAGKIPIDVNAMHLDLLSISGHKLYAPKGVGALYVGGGTKLRQLLYGGHHQRGARPGTENVAGAVAFGKAAQIAKKSLAQESLRVAALRDQLESGLLAKIPHSFVNCAESLRAPNTTNISFPGIEGESLIIALDLKGIACSAGAACSSGAVEPSHVLTALGLPAADARSSIRFSLGKPTTAEEIETCLSVVPAVVEQLRELSPTYRKLAETR